LFIENIFSEIKANRVDIGIEITIKNIIRKDPMIKKLIVDGNNELRTDTQPGRNHSFNPYPNGTELTLLYCDNGKIRFA
jgi:hypothetical protein